MFTYNGYKIQNAHHEKDWLFNLIVLDMGLAFCLVYMPVSMKCIELYYWIQTIFLYLFWTYKIFNLSWMIKIGYSTYFLLLLNLDRVTIGYFIRCSETLIHGVYFFGYRSIFFHHLIVFTILLKFFSQIFGHMALHWYSINW